MWSQFLKKYPARFAILFAVCLMAFASVTAAFAASKPMSGIAVRKDETPSAAASSPRDALSARTEESFYVTAHVDDFGGNLRNFFSQAKLDALTSLMPRGDAEQVRFFAETIASQIPAKSVAFVFGLEKARLDYPFFQLAVSVPEDSMPALERVARGEATPDEIVTLVAGKASQPFAAAFADASVKQGTKGPYYELALSSVLSPALAARNGVLLIALSYEDLEASIDALEKEENRLLLKRRFDTPNYYCVHMDVPTMISFGKSIGVPVDYYTSILPLLDIGEAINIEIALAPQQYTLSSNVNFVLPLALMPAAMMYASGSAADSDEATKIINDLRSLKSACLLFYADMLNWPSNSDIAKLDDYTDRPLVKGGYYAAVMIGPEYDDKGVKRNNIGVKLKPDTNGASDIQKKLAQKAKDVGLLANSTGLDPYVSGLEIWMNMR